MVMEVIEEDQQKAKPDPNPYGDQFFT